MAAGKSGGSGSFGARNSPRTAPAYLRGGVVPQGRVPPAPPAAAELPEDGQRGGCPTCKDRVYASMMGAMAADLLCAGKTNRVVGYQHGEFQDFDIDEALQMAKGIAPYQYEIALALSTH